MSLFDQITSLADLQQLIASDERESDLLEYKTASSRAKTDTNEAAKDISAFANSLGGVLIYGVATDQLDKTKPARLEPIDPTVVDVIVIGAPAKIRHPIAGIRWKTLPIGETPQALIVDVPPSALAPHQVISTQRYYRRFGAESAPMTHDLVELYFGRRMGPVLQPKLLAERVAGPRAAGGYFLVKIAIVNVGQRIARDSFFWLEFDRAFEWGDISWYGLGTNDNATRGAKQAITRRTGMLFYPGIPLELVQGQILLQELNRPVLHLETYADEMQPRRYSVDFTKNNDIGEPQIRWEYLGAPVPFE